MKIRNLLIAAAIVGGATAVISAHGNTPEAQAPIIASKAPQEPMPNGSHTNLSFAQKRQHLLKYRGADEICTSDGGDCMLWTNLALHCERQLNGERTDYDKPCTSAESFRERVTGIELSTDPGAYSF